MIIVEETMCEDLQRSFSINKLLTQTNDPPAEEPNNEESRVEKEDNSSTRTSSSVSPMSESEAIVPEGLAGMLGFNPLLMQQMAQNAAFAFSQNQQQTKKVNPTTMQQALPTKRLEAQQQDTPTTSTQIPPANATPEWYNAMNYLNMASRQLQFMSANHSSEFFK